MSDQKDDAERDDDDPDGPWAKINSGDTESMTTDEDEPAGGTGPHEDGDGDGD